LTAEGFAVTMKSGDAICYMFKTVSVVFVHFGEGHTTPVLMQIRSSQEAQEDLLEDCGHPRHAPLHLKVTAVSGCDGFEPVRH
jgi:hypothetical protein